MGEQTSTKTNINWFPGHMAKTRRMIAENLKDVDVVFELLDARIPQSSENPEIAGLTAGKPRLTLLSKTSLADPLVTENWKVYFHSVQRPCIFYDCRTGEGISEIAPAMRQLCADKLQKYKERGMKGRKVIGVAPWMMKMGTLAAVTAAISALPSRPTMKVSAKPRDVVIRFCKMMGRDRTHSRR